jgi:hypothetical protein
MSAPDTIEDTLDAGPAAAPSAETPRLRHDGWTPERQRRFLESVAEGHTVEEACRIVGLSVASAYALRRRAAGAGFALGWHGANLLARERIADTLLVRAIHGQTETGTRPDGGTWTRHRDDNSLATRMLARLDAQADDPAAGPAHRAARMVAQEFDTFLDLLARDAGPARAALFLAARAEDTPDVEPVVALARADRFLQAGAGLAAEVDVSDCDPAHRAHWTADQWQRAEAAGLLRLAEPEPEPEPKAAAPRPQLPQLPPVPPPPTERAEPVWWCDYHEEWRTRFPPPPDFEGDCDGRYGEEDYERALTLDEVEMMRAHEDEKYAADHDARDAWFAGLCAGDAAPRSPPAAAPGPHAPDPIPRSIWNPVPWPMTVPILSDEDYFDEEDLAGLAALDAMAAEDALAAAQALQTPDDVPPCHDGSDEPAPPPLVNPGELQYGNDSMSIFGKIKTAIFGKDGGPFGDNYFGQKDRAEAKAGTVTQTKTVPVHIPEPVPGAATPPQTTAAEPTSHQPVDVEAVLKAREAAHPGLNWRTSIVDLMKLLELDPSLANRKELATELGYTGAKDGSAEMNIWLHKAVMRELAANGGTVPADLRD